MLYEIVGTELAQGDDLTGTESYILAVRNDIGELEDQDGINDIVTWSLTEGDGTDLISLKDTQSRLSTGRYKVTFDWIDPTDVSKPFYWTVKAAFTNAYGASIEQEFITNFHPVAESDLVLIDGSDNYTRGWRESIAEVWSALRGPTAGTDLIQTHEHADGTSAFTVTVSTDGDRTYS